MSPEKADKFARDLNRICHQNGVMLWTAFAAAPMCLSDADPDDNYYYVADRAADYQFTSSFTVRRVVR